MRANIVVSKKYGVEPTDSDRHIHEILRIGTTPVGGQGTAGPSSQADGTVVETSSINRETVDLQGDGEEMRILSAEELSYFQTKDFSEDEIRRVATEIIQIHPGVAMKDVKNLQRVKNRIAEATTLPIKYPDYFVGIRTPYKGLLLFGPPGTGKTLLVKAVATEITNCRFFIIRGSTIASPYRGISERLVRLIFLMAKYKAPAIILIDELDAICSRRGIAEESETSRKVLGELLTNMEGIESTSSLSQKVLVIAATNRPWDIDDALLRRFEKRLYVPIPEASTRLEMMIEYLSQCQISEDVDMNNIANSLEGFSGHDVKNYCREVALMAMREKRDTLSPEVFEQLTSADLDGLVTQGHFQMAKDEVKPSVTPETIRQHQSWSEKFGSR